MMCEGGEVIILVSCIRCSTDRISDETIITAMQIGPYFAVTKVGGATCKLAKSLLPTILFEWAHHRKSYWGVNIVRPKIEGMYLVQKIYYM